MTIKEMLKERMRRLETLTERPNLLLENKHPDDIALVKGALMPYLRSYLQDIEFDYYSTDDPIGYVRDVRDKWRKRYGE